jgi:predicted RNA-binding protein with PIN domain
MHWRKLALALAFAIAFKSYQSGVNTPFLVRMPLRQLSAFCPKFLFHKPNRLANLTMALVRILVDGYSLLHSWPELAPGKARHSAAARDELIHVLTLYRDATHTPISIFFDGSSPKLGGPSTTPSTPDVEILFSRAGQTADQMIERAAVRFQPYGEVLAVTDDSAERETVINLGGMASSCWNFIQTVQNTLAELQDEIKHHNRRERNKFNRRS